MSTSLFNKDQRSSLVTKIILIAWLIIVCWNSEKIFNVDASDGSADQATEATVTSVDQPLGN